MRASSCDRSTVRICETFATESFGNPVREAASRTLPGAAASRRLLVSGTTTAVATRLALKFSPCTTTTGRRNLGEEQTGSSSDGQQTSPCPITIRCVRASDEPPPRQTLGAQRPTRPRPRSAQPSRLPTHAAQRSPRAPPDRPRSGSSRAYSPVRRPARTDRLGSRRPPSYREYDCQGSVTRRAVGAFARSVSGGARGAETPPHEPSIGQRRRQVRHLLPDQTHLVDIVGVGHTTAHLLRNRRPHTPSRSRLVQRSSHRLRITQTTRTHSVKRRSALPSRRT